MYDFETEYRKIFETPMEQIREDIFFRADNFGSTEETAGKSPVCHKQEVEKGR